MHKLALSLIVLATTSTVEAKPKPQAKGSVKVHMERAAKAHKAGKFDVALTELKAAYEVEPQPKLLYAIAQVYAKLDNCDDAIDYYERFLAADRSKQAVVKQAIDACKKKLPDQPDTSDQPVKGDAAFRARKGDEVPATEPKQIEAAPPAAEPPLEPAPPPSEQEPPRRVEPPPPRLPEPVRNEPVALTTQTTYSPWYRDALGDALVLAGVGATVGSLFTYRGAQSDLDQAEEAPTLSDYTDLRDSAESKQLYTVLLAGGGIALVTAGVLRYALRDNRRETRGVVLVPNLGGGLITWSGGF